MAENLPNIGHAPADTATRDAIHFAVQRLDRAAQEATDVRD